MSIWSTLPGLDADTPGGQPWRYYNSAVMPGRPGQRRGNISLAQIPSHITPDGRDDGPEDGRPWPWLRLALDWTSPDSVAVLTVEQARHLADQLTEWADRAQPGAGQDTAETATGARESDEHPAARGQSCPGGAFGPQAGAQRREVYRAAFQRLLPETAWHLAGALADTAAGIAAQQHHDALDRTEDAENRYRNQMLAADKLIDERNHLEAELEQARRAVDRVLHWATELEHPRHRGQPGIPAPVIARQLRDLIQTRP